MALKELVDNALDAAETAGVQPEIAIEASTDGLDLRLSVSDNGPGLPAGVLTRILDFDTRTSDKLAYRAPTRGLQGNALKTIIGLPMALGGDAPLVIDSGGRRHEIRARVNPVGEAVVEHESCVRPTPTGTTLSLQIPVDDQELDAVWWARSFALLNPHASISVKTHGFGGDDVHQIGDPVLVETADFYQSLVAFPADWRKWLPGDPTSPHWYDAATLQMLIYGQLPQLLLRDFVRQFGGLTGTQKAKAIADRFPGIKRLFEIADDTTAVAALLVAMQAEAQPVRPQRLGLIGADTIRARFAEWYGEGDRFWYDRRLGVDHEGVPFAVEVAIAETFTPGPLVCGLNFSPAFSDPFMGSRLAGGKITDTFGIVEFLQDAHVRAPLWVEYDVASLSTAALVHIVSPRLTTLDRGKSRLAPSPALRLAVGEALWRAAKALYEEGERRKKDAARQAQRDDARRTAATKAARAERWNLNDAVFAVMEEAWAAATGNGAQPASARTIFYQARPLIQDYTTEKLKDTYFTQTLLPDYQREVRELPNVYYEPRGTFHEPHTGVTVPLGTREVDAYDFPRWTYNKILFIEKKGLWPPLQAAQLAERYDMAIVAGEGLATVAARRLLERADTDQRYQIFVAHDADPGGYKIARTLAEETRRMPGYSVDVIDLGLRFEDGLAMGLGTEAFTRVGSLGKAVASTLTERERQAFVGRPTVRNAKGKMQYACERIELNAMTSPQLIAYIEEGLDQHGATEKVIPPADVVAQHALLDARASLRTAAAAAIERIIDTEALIEQFMASELAGEIAGKAVDVASRDVIVEDLERNRVLPWTRPVQTWANVTVNRDEEAIVAAIEAMLAKEERSS
jgi:DNA topoisomerase VI subunit B